MSTRQQRVIDTPLDFADWADGPRVRSVNEVDGEMRARVEAAFVAAEAQAAERLQEVDETVRQTLVRDVTTMVEESMDDLRSRVAGLEKLVEELRGELRETPRGRATSTRSRKPRVLRFEKAQSGEWHVTPARSGGWAVRKEGAKRASSTHATKSEAVREAKRLTDSMGKKRSSSSKKARSSASKKATKK